MAHPVAATVPSGNPLRQLVALGQSPWLDYTTRTLIRSRELHRLIAEDGVRGLTTNPTIFEHAIAGDSVYDADIIALAEAGFSPDEILEQLMVDEVREACDAFRPLYEESLGREGYVSLEVSPGVARDTDATVAEARRLWSRVGRRNLMVKIPATREGLAAIEECLTIGINVNATLLFSVTRYRGVRDAYLAAIGARRVSGLPLDWLASVASIFVRRVDQAVDAELTRLGTPEALALRGKAGIANATLAYEAFLAMMAGQVWRRLAADGARPQRPLWASTGVKDAGASALRYCDALTGACTVITLRRETLATFRESGAPQPRLDATAIGAAHGVVAALANLGIPLDRIAETLETEGLERFSQSWDSLLAVVDRKASVLATRA